MVLHRKLSLRGWESSDGTLRGGDVPSGSAGGDLFAQDRAELGDEVLDGTVVDCQLAPLGAAPGRGDEGGLP